MVVFIPNERLTVDDQYKKFPAALTTARETAGLTQKELGDRIGKTQQAVAKWENGESNPTRRSMGKLISVLPALKELGLPALYLTDHIRPNDANRGPQTPPNLIEMSASAHRAQVESQFMMDIILGVPNELQANFRRTREVDYESSKAVIQIYVLQTHSHPFALPYRLWRLSTLRLKQNDGRAYYFLIVRAPDQGAGGDYRHQMHLTQQAVEASLHGINLLVADSAAHASEIITSIEMDDPEPTTDKNFYNDEEPHD